MMVADSQVHIWAADSPERPWPKMEHKPPRETPFSAQDLLQEMDSAGVHRAVIVPPTWEGERNDLGLAAAKAYPDRFAVMGRLNPDSPGAREQIAHWKQQPGMLGLRFTFARPAVWAPLVEQRWDWLWPELEMAGIPVMMAVCPPQLHFVDKIAENNPGLKIVIDHLARQSGKVDEEAFRELDKLLSMAKRPNIAVKASGMPAYTSDSYPYRRLHAVLRRAYDAFGPERMFWGTDLTKLTCTYRQSVTMFTEELPWLTRDDKESIMGRGLCKWLGWKLP